MGGTGEHDLLAALQNVVLALAIAGDPQRAAQAQQQRAGGKLAAPHLIPGDLNLLGGFFRTSLPRSDALYGKGNCLYAGWQPKVQCYDWSQGKTAPKSAKTSPESYRNWFEQSIQNGWPSRSCANHGTMTPA